MRWHLADFRRPVGRRPSAHPRRAKGRCPGGGVLPGSVHVGRSLLHLRREVGAHRVQIVLLDPQAGCSCGRSSGAARRVSDGFCRRAISPCGLNENAPVWLCLRQQLSSQPPTHRQARSPMAKRRQGSQSQPAPAERQGGLLAKNSGSFCSPLPRRDIFLRKKS